MLYNAFFISSFQSLLCRRRLYGFGLCLGDPGLGGGVTLARPKIGME